MRKIHMTGQELAKEIRANQRTQGSVARFVQQALAFALLTATYMTIGYYAVLAFMP
jgi:hypothetical protein